MTRKIRLFHCSFPAKYEIQFDSIFWGVLDGGNIRNCAERFIFNISDKLEHFYIFFSSRSTPGYRNKLYFTFSWESAEENFQSQKTWYKTSPCFLGARAPLGLAPVKKKKLNEKVLK